MPSRDEIFNAKILVVDDCADNIDLLQEILKETGYTSVTATTDSASVCALHAEHYYDLILLDLQMPDFDGFQVMEGLRDIEKGGYLPVLALTAQPQFKIKALEAGARDFISKPFDLHEVRQRIHNMLEVRLLYKELAHYSRKQQELALHDPLTNLPNRRLLEDRLSTAMQHARRNHQKTAVLYLDLDGFKDVNDTYGHTYGDDLLKMVAERLVGASRQEDTVARIGGDEFMVILPDLANVADVHGPATKLIEVVSAPYHVGEVTLRVTTSIGIGVYPDHADSVTELITLADNALYEAKRSGKNRYKVADPAAPAQHALAAANR